jgi:hypothetical protein
LINKTEVENIVQVYFKYTIIYTCSCFHGHYGISDINNERNGKDKKKGPGGQVNI